MEFTNIITLSEYSFLNSVIRIKELINFHKSKKLKYVALCEENVMYSAQDFLKQALSNDLKPVLSIKFKLYNDNLEDSSDAVITAMNYQGYKNLMIISSKLNNFKNNKVIFSDIENFIKTNNLLIVKNKMIINRYKDYQNIYYGITNKSETQDYNKTIPWHEVKFLTPNQEIAFKTIQAIKDNKSLSDINNTSNNCWIDLEEAKIYHNQKTLSNLENVLKKIDLTLPKNKISFMQYKKNVNNAELLSKNCLIGLRWRAKQNIDIKNNFEIYQKRLNHEIEIINNLGWESYFLLVWDVIRFAKKNNISVGPGRGSAGGSLVVFSLGITNIDPIKYNLIFERFLNPERVSMPDIDIDFQDNRRQEVINYLFDKFGIKHMAHIIIFQTIGAKTALRDSGRILQIDLNIINAICKIINTKDHLLKIYHNNLYMRAQVNINKKVKDMFRIACQIQGLVRQSGIHAAGVVFSDQDMANYCPVKSIDEKTNITQYSMNFLEEVGLIKVDFLGLRALSIIKNINESGPNINLENIDLNDQKTFKLLSNANTTGIFQLESFGMRNVLRKIQINNFEDIVSAISLYRPGPQDNIDLFVSRKHKLSKISYPDQRLEPILKYTFGIIIYQEQIMQIAQLVADFSLAKSDLLRRAMSKKNHHIMDDLKKEFITNAVKNKYNINSANLIFDLIYKFANYGFNRAHAVAYSKIAYQLAYLKSNYYLYFIINLLTNAINDKVKIKELLVEAQVNNIKILKININRSNLIFENEDNNIRMPLTIIKGMGKITLNKLIDERKKELFKDFFDFVSRMFINGYNEATFKTLIYSGALDSFANRGSLLNSLNNAINYAHLVAKINDVQTILIDKKIIDEPQLFLCDDDVSQLSQQEKNVLGFNWFMHPTTPFIKLEKKYVYPEIQIKQNKYNNIRAILQINDVRTIMTKKDQKMMFLTASDLYNSFELVVFPDKYKQLFSVLKTNNIIDCMLKIEKNNKNTNKGNSLILKSLNKIFKI